MKRQVKGVPRIQSGGRVRVPMALVLAPDASIDETTAVIKSQLTRDGTQRASGRSCVPVYTRQSSMLSLED